MRSATANATIASYLNGSVAINGTIAGAAVITGNDVEGLARGAIENKHSTDIER